MMKKYIMMKHGLFLLVPMMVTVAAIASFVFAQSQQNQSPNNTNEQERTYEEERAFREALRKGGVKEAAKIKGNYVGTYDPFWNRPQLDIEGLTKNSELVVVGVPIKNRCRLTRDGFIIMTVYDVTVQEVIKGNNVQIGDTIKVALPGGKIGFPDGTTAEIQTPDFEKMINGRTYALYLYEIRRGDGDLYADSSIHVYDLTAGPYGLFELPMNGAKVKSHARPTDPVAKETKEKDPQTFLNEARLLAAKWPKPSKCCK